MSKIMNDKMKIKLHNIRKKEKVYLLYYHGGIIKNNWEVIE